MKFLSSIFLLVSSAAALSLEGVYKYQSSVKSSKGTENNLSARVIVDSIEGNAHYSMRVVDIELQEEKVKLPRLPFEFLVNSDGQIVSVLTDQRDTIQSKNLKKAIVESFQTRFVDSIVEESGSSGTRKVHYKSNVNGKINEIFGTYDRSDFTSFPKGSNIEKTDANISGMKKLNFEDDSFLSSSSKVELSFFDSFDFTTVVSESSLSFVERISDEYAVEGSENLVKESLVHEISFEQQISRLSAIIGNPSEYIDKLLSEGVSKKDSLKMESKLLNLADLDQNYANQIIDSIARKIEDSPNKRLFFTLSRINSPNVDAILSEKLKEMVNSKNNEMVYSILRALNQMKRINVESPIFKVLNSLEFPEEVKGMSELTIGSLCKHLNKEESDQILSKFINELENENEIEDDRKVHLLYVLGNARQNSPTKLISSFLEHQEESVRSTAVFGLRGTMDRKEIQREIVSSIKSRPMIENKRVLSNLLKGIKENQRNSKRRENFEELDKFLETLRHNPVVNDLPESSQKIFRERLPLLKKRSEPIKLFSSTSVWNDSSDPLYNFAAPLARRQEDVDRYPSNEAFINAEMFGPRLANLKFVTGVFSGQGSPGCLAGNFKIFDHLYTETAFLGENHLLADLELYILTYDLAFDSRIYGNINGNVIVDFKITSNCSDGVLPVFDGEIDLIDYFAEIPIDLGTVDVSVRATAGLEFNVGYKLCILVLNPYVELYLTGKIDLVGDAEVLITVFGLVRAGIDADAYFNYEIGPETQIGTRTNGTCEACIGIYHGYDRQYVELELWFQRREGLGWGDPTVIPLFSWEEPALPFPTTIIETCGDI